MQMMILARVSVLAAVMVTATAAMAFQEIPRASAKALGVTKGSAFSSGMVFIDGKYLEPPYVVERWGTGIRINSKPVTGQIIDWNDFLKTQSGVKAVKTEIPVETVHGAQSVVVSSAPKAKEVDYVSALDDLFGDDPAPKATAKPIPTPVAAPIPAPAAKPKVAVAYELNGDFVRNEASDLLVKRINAARTEIDRILRTGGVICFGDSYSRVTGDSRIASKVLDALPEIQKNSTTIDAFRQGVRRADLVYFNEVLCEELFRNRVDYRKLQERRAKVRRDQRWQNALKDVSAPLF